METNWKNREISWSDLVQRLSKTVTTHETHKEFLAFPRPVQDEKKDVGGFVGGIIQGGRRKSGSVTARYLVTLDIDFATVGFWNDFKAVFNVAACIYGTHKHSPDTPRFRLVIPLSHEVFADQYQAIGRKIAEILGIDLFDPTTFQAERLMHWPSTPKDIEYYFQVQDGPFLDPSAILGRYADWRDTSQWAFSSRAKGAIAKSAEKQGDPMEKPGVVGAFCRTYSIAEAVETYLADVYTETDDPERYTYVHGSTTAGLIVYEDKFAYSHHGTDPVSGRLCNAFDLIRLHLYSKLDDEVKPDTPVHKRPSHLAMEQLGLKDKNVSKELSLTKLKEAGYDFTDVDISVDMDWVKLLKKDARGNVISTSTNIYIILKHDPYLKDCFVYNSFENRDCAVKDLPWRSVKPGGDFLKDSDDAALRNYLDKNYNLTGQFKIADAFRQLMIEHQVHPVLEYLKSRTWDCVSRLDMLLIDFLGAEDNEYVRAVTRKAFVAAVARVYEPGIKYQTALTLVGPQGCGKSTLLAKMGQQWFSDSLGSIDNDKITEQLQGVWIMEIAELSGFKKADVDKVKHFVAKGIDRFRVAFGKRTEVFPRQCVFFPTTNKDDFLTDQTGNRRFWPVTVAVKPGKDIDKDLTPTIVNQLWAEAVDLYHRGETIYLSKSLEAMAAGIQEDHIEKDPREERIARYLDRLIPANWYAMETYERKEWLQGKDMGVMERHKVSPIEIYCELFNGLAENASYWNTKYIRDYLGRLKDWKKHIVTHPDYGNQRGYLRIESLM